jgi:hypothetical protein
MNVNTFDITSFMECAVKQQLDIATCAKIIKYYVGDEFETLMKCAIADEYIRYHLELCGLDISRHKINFMVRVIRNLKNLS